MNTTYVYIVAVAVLMGGLLVLTQLRQPEGGNQLVNDTSAYDTFSQCLADAGAVFYGTFWCPYCQKQKDLLQNSVFIPYIECSTPDGKGQTKICIDENISGYPTWKFANGTSLTGALSLQTLSEQTGCPAPSL